MNKLLAALVAGLFAAGSYAQVPPTPGSSTDQSVSGQAAVGAEGSTMKNTKKPMTRKERVAKDGKKRRMNAEAGSPLASTDPSTTNQSATTASKPEGSSAKNMKKADTRKQKVPMTTDAQEMKLNANAPQQAGDGGSQKKAK